MKEEFSGGVAILNRAHRSVRHIVPIALLVVFGIGIRPHVVRGLSPDATCRKSLAAGTRRVAAAVLKGAERCHRDRMRGDLPAAIVGYLDLAGEAR